MKKFLVILPKNTITTPKKLINRYSYFSLKHHGLIRVRLCKFTDIITGITKMVDLYKVCVGHDLVIFVDDNDKIKYLGFGKWQLVSSKERHDF